MTKFRYVLLLVMLFPLQSCALYYSAAPIDATVVDAETGIPLEGVIVTANWQLKGGLEGGNDFGQMMVMEAVTDQSGRFYFPAWGPKRNVSDGHIKFEGPRLMLFKSGYSYLSLFNETRVTDRPGPFLKSDWNGKTIKLEKFKGDMKEYARYLSIVDTQLSFAYSGKTCYWKNIPHMIGALYQQGNVFRANGIPDWTISIVDVLLSNDRFYTESDCGSPREFLKEFLDEGNNPPPDKPPALPRQTPPSHMYGPPPGFVPPISK